MFHMRKCLMTTILQRAYSFNINSFWAHWARVLKLMLIAYSLPCCLGKQAQNLINWISVSFEMEYLAAIKSITDENGAFF